MKHPTVKRPPRSRWRRVTRWWWALVAAWTEVPEPRGLPSYEELKARAKR